MNDPTGYARNVTVLEPWKGLISSGGGRVRINPPPSILCIFARHVIAIVTDQKQAGSG
jgi:hypothetical protein